MTTKSQMAKLLGSLYLDRENGWVAGVCAGLAERLDIDLNVLRIVTVAAAWFATFPVVVVYGAAAFLLKDRPLESKNPSGEREFWRTGSHRRSF